MVVLMMVLMVMVMFSSQGLGTDVYIRLKHLECSTGFQIRI